MVPKKYEQVLGLRETLAVSLESVVDAAASSGKVDGSVCTLVPVIPAHHLGCSPGSGTSNHHHLHPREIKNKNEKQSAVETLPQELINSQSGFLPHGSDDDGNLSLAAPSACLTYSI